MLSPGRTTRMSSTFTSAMGTSRVLPSAASRSTVFGRRPISFLMALLVPALARSSRNLPSRMKVMTTAAASKYTCGISPRSVQNCG